MQPSSLYTPAERPFSLPHQLDGITLAPAASSSVAAALPAVLRLQAPGQPRASIPHVQ